MAFLLAPVCICQVDESCPSPAYDRNPKLISSLGPLKQAARGEGYSGRLVFQLTVTETGSVRNSVVTYPPQLIHADSIQEQIRKLRFCPAVKYSRYTAVEVNFDIETK